MKTAKLKVVKIEETDSWSEDIVSKAGKIFGVYIFDETIETFCTEVTPSRYLRFLNNFAENSIDDETDEEIRIASSGEDNNMYVHCGQADKMKVEKEYTFEYEGEEDGEDYLEKLEEILEYELCNPTVC